MEAQSGSKRKPSRSTPNKPKTMGSNHTDTKNYGNPCQTHQQLFTSTPNPWKTTDINAKHIGKQGNLCRKIKSSQKANNFTKTQKYKNSSMINFSIPHSRVIELAGPQGASAGIAKRNQVPMKCIVQTAGGLTQSTRSRPSQSNNHASQCQIHEKPLKFTPHPTKNSEA